MTIIFSEKIKQVIIGALLPVAVMLFVVCGLAGCGSENPSLSPGLTADGTYEASVTLEGGSGKATIESPCKLTVSDGSMNARLVWSSTHYDYMIVDGTKYLNENPGGNSTFTVPVPVLGEPFPVIGDTTAMSEPHEIEYMLTITIDDGGSSRSDAEDNDAESAAAAGSTIPSVGADFAAQGTQYATQFSDIDNEDGTRTIIFSDGQKIVLVPKEMEIPENIDADAMVLRTPLENIYAVSTGILDMFDSIDALDNLAFSSLTENTCRIDDIKPHLASGEIKYAGKYSAPDYEMLLTGGCDLVIENTMIYHSPEVKEKLEKLGIPVIVEYSSYEKHPLGRSEWVKVFGAIAGRDDAAAAAFSEQEEIYNAIPDKNNTGSNVVFFYVSSDKTINVRRPDDYIAKMIEMAGGNYPMDESLSNAVGATSTISMSVEDFYLLAKDCDYIIYNGSIGGMLESTDRLCMLSDIFTDFKAVKNKNVYCVRDGFLQSSMHSGEIIAEINDMLSGNLEDGTYLYHVR